MSRVLALLVTLTCLCDLSLSWPLPQSLTEEQFRSFGDDPRPENQVKIVSGYSNIARFGRGFDNSPLKTGAPNGRQLTVKSPLELAMLSSTPVRKSAVFEDDEGPVFDLEEMLAQQELKRRIEEANKKEEELRQKEWEQQVQREREELEKQKLAESEAAEDDALNKILDDIAKEEQKVLVEIEEIEEEFKKELEEEDEEEQLEDGEENQQEVQETTTEDQLKEEGDEVHVVAVVIEDPEEEVTEEATESQTSTTEWSEESTTTEGQQEEVEFTEIPPFPEGEFIRRDPEAVREEEVTTEADLAQDDLEPDYPEDKDQPPMEIDLGSVQEV